MGKDIDVIVCELNRLEEKGDNELKTEITELRKELADLIRENCVISDENGIIITDEEIYNNFRPEIPFDRTEKYVEENNEKVVMVHCTDFFPKNHRILTNFDGNKKGKSVTITYDGVTKECKALQHRHTSHYVLNSRVKSTGDGYGNWESTKFMVIEPYKTHSNQFVYKSVSDAYTYGSVDLSDDAVIMVREDCIEEIPEDEKNKYQIVRFVGNPEQCVKNFLQLNEYPIFVTNPKDNHHYNSKYMELEEQLNHRDFIINYIKDNEYLSREPIKLKKEEIFTMFNIGKQNFQNSYRIPFSDVSDFATSNNISQKFLSFYVLYGCMDAGDGEFYFKSDEKILQILTDVWNDRFQNNDVNFEKILINNGINIGEIKNFYDEYLQKECEELDMPSFFEKNEESKDKVELFEEYYKETMGNRCHLNKDELEIAYGILYERELEERKTRPLQRKISEFDEYNKKFVLGTPQTIANWEVVEYNNILEKTMENINKKLQENGIDSYKFNMIFLEGENIKTLVIRNADYFQNSDDILSDLHGKEHFDRADVDMTYAVSVAKLDFNMRQEDETVAEFLERLNQYTENFSRYYDGHTIDESVKFDENGNLIETPKIEKSDFEKIATSKEAVSELQAGQVMREIRTEISKEGKTNEEVGVEYD